MAEIRQRDRLKALETLDELIPLYRAEGIRLRTEAGMQDGVVRATYIEKADQTAAVSERLEQVRAVVSDAIRSRSRRKRGGQGPPDEPS